MTRKRSPPKAKSVADRNGATNGGSVRSKTGRDSISGDLTSYARVFLLAALVVGFTGFLLYPDILSVVKAVHEKALDVLYESNSGQRSSDALSDPPEGIKQNTKREMRSENEAAELQPPADDESIDDDVDVEVEDEEPLSVVDEEKGDLMEDEEVENKHKRLQNSKAGDKSRATRSKPSKPQANPETEKGNSSMKDKSGSSSAPKEKSTNSPPTNKFNVEDATVSSPPKNKVGGKTGPIILTPENNEIVLDPSQIKIVNSQSDGNVDQKPKRNKKSAGASKSTGKKQDRAQSTVNDEKKTKGGDTVSSGDDNVLEEAKKFKSKIHKTFTPKKIFAGGRRIPPVELLHQKESNSSVRVFLFDDFLSEQECDGLRKAHDSHVKAMDKPPLLCFDSIGTLRKHLQDAKKNVKVTPNDFTKGTKCVNASFSLQIQTWLKSNWSYSTAFYPGESPFSTAAANRIQQAMGLDPSSGGKFQITSYPEGKAYKEHTDCIVGGVDKRDRVVSVLMYLSDVEEGGETAFPDLGIWVRPRKGRALVWNNMSPEGECEPHSKHVASVVKKGSKYILIRWYYYKTFYSLGKRPPPPHLPEREEGQPMVNCDEYNSGSCRWYDEWSYEPLLEYEKSRLTLV